MNKALLIIMAVYLVGFCVCAVISVPLIMWAVRKNDEEEGYYEPMETPELFGKASLTAWIISTVWFFGSSAVCLNAGRENNGKG